jgi:hypothetical protein
MSLSRETTRVSRAMIWKRNGSQSNSSPMEYVHTYDSSGKKLVIRKVATLEDAQMEIASLRAQLMQQAKIIREMALEIEALQLRYGLDPFGRPSASE